MREAAERWGEYVESGDVEYNQIPDDSTWRTVHLTDNDLIVIHEALKRQFVGKKSTRVQTLHAVQGIRGAMRNILEEHQ